MGIGIAIPKRFEVIDTEIAVVHDKKPAELSMIRGLLKRWTPFIRDDPWALAARPNRLLLLAFREPETSREFTIATYHMPCLFGSTEKRAAVVIHTATALRILEEFSKDRPRIFCGDFNFAPSAGAYQLVTTGCLVEDVPFGELPETEPLQSAYAVCGGEPEFTNYAQIEDQDIFAETLDYIFMSSQWKVSSVEKLPIEEQKNIGPNPSENEPSDHYLLGAELEV